MFSLYRIINKVSDRQYIGFTKYWPGRKAHHKWYLRNNCHKNKELQKDFNDLKEDSFEFEEIMKFPDIEQVKKAEEIVIEEHYNNLYNVHVGHKQTSKTIEKISKNNAKYWLNKKRPDISKLMKEKTGANNSRYDHNIYLFVHITGAMFEGTRQEFYQKFNLDSSAVGRLVRNEYTTVKGWTCRIQENAI